MKYVKIEGGIKLSKFISPMSARLSDKPAFDDPNWLFEIKWDGYRAVAELKGKDTRFYSRNGLSYTKAYPKIYNELIKLKFDAVLDGEVVVFRDGLPSFQAIQNYKSTQNLPIQFIVFDCIQYKGEDLTRLKLIERKEILKDILPENEIIRYCDHIEGEGIALFEQARKINLEGIIAKKSDSRYSPDKRSKDWLKIKNVNVDDFKIVGWTDPKASRQYFGALLLAHEVNDQLIFAGEVGTGFTHELLKSLHTKLRPLETDDCPLDVPVKKEKGFHWTKPKYSAQVQYAEMTDDGHVRHPSFLGLRKDK
ncbi:non-homologous end-joining DNA ligase [Chryseolinea sp. T2]|uniref:non-homologous end-joining DNA ligase n=1 Tax=Chryseolinea sp. T2 TaxID=3129255 RepID=UPI00307830ED